MEKKEIAKLVIKVFWTGFWVGIVTSLLARGIQILLA